MIFQPLAENSIKHGVFSSTEIVKVWLDAELKDDDGSILDNDGDGDDNVSDFDDDIDLIDEPEFTDDYE